MGWWQCWSWRVVEREGRSNKEIEIQFKHFRRIVVAQTSMVAAIAIAMMTTMMGGRRARQKKNVIKKFKTKAH